MERRQMLFGAGLATLVLVCGAAPVSGADSRAELTFTRVHGGYSVWVANADGSGARKVVARAYGGRLSPSGRRLAFWRFRSTSTGGFFVVDLAGGKPQWICNACAARWSPREDTLAIVDGIGLHLVDPDSGARRRLVGDRNLADPSFSPDGRDIAYAKVNDGVGAAFRSDIFTVRISDGAVTQLTHDGHSRVPIWGPNWIVYMRHHWAGGLSPMGRLWLMRPDGSEKRAFARGAEGRDGNDYPVFGLDPLALSKDGRRLLACQAFEFGCSRVTFTVPGGKRYGFPKLQPFERDSGARPTDLSRDGARILIDVGSPHDDGNHRIYEMPFVGGEVRLIARDAIDARWAQ